MPSTYSSLPQPGEYGPGFGTYIALVPPGDVLGYLESQLADVVSLLRGMTDAEAMAIHPPYAWTIKQVLGHMTDCERVFGHRALRIGRHDATPLASFDENAYMTAAEFNRAAMSDLIEEFQLVRRGHLLMFRHFSTEAMLHIGVVNHHSATTRAFAYAIAGHTKHHLDILHKRLGR